MLTKFQVGERFPLDIPIPLDSMLLHPQQHGTFDLIIRLNKPSAKEKDDVRKGAFSWGVFVQEAVPFVVMRFRETNLELDATLNVLKINATDREHWLSKNANAVNIYLVDEMMTLRAMRLIGAEHEMMQSLRDAARQQAEQYDSISAVNAAIIRIQSQHSLVSMLRNTKLYTVIR